MNFRGFNSITYKHKFLLPHIQECLRAFDRKVFISFIDLSNSFYQVPVNEHVRDKLAFVARRSEFRLTRLGQGSGWVKVVTSRPAVFCRLMSFSRVDFTSRMY